MYSTLHKCKECGSKLSKNECKWDTGLCNSCFDFQKKKKKAIRKGWCYLCLESVTKKEREYKTGLCNSCFDKEKERKRKGKEKERKRKSTQVVIKE